jgi:hypothetical protein
MKSDIELVYGLICRWKPLAEGLEDLIQLPEGIVSWVVM